MQEGIWVEGVADPDVGYLHCEYLVGYCLHAGNGQMVWGGLFHNIDTSTTVVGGVIHLGKAIDNHQTLLSLVSPVVSGGNIVTDDLNLSSPITTTSFPKGLGQYFPNGKEYVKRLREALTFAFREAGLNFDARRVVVSEPTVSNEVGYRLKGSSSGFTVNNAGNQLSQSLSEDGDSV